MFLDVIGNLLETFRGQIIGIPLDNPLSYIYVVLNIVLLFFASLMYSQDG